MDVKTYEPAFPYKGQEWFNHGGTMRQRDVYWTGMSLRDYFAAKAMQPILDGAVLPTKEAREEWLPRIAGLAYEVADAMLKAREESQT